MRGAALAVAICATCAAQWRGRSVKNTRSSEDDPLAAKFSWIPSNDAFALNKIAQASQNKEGVEYLIDKEGYRPLHLAAQQGFVEVVPELLRLGADANARLSDLAPQGRMTVLHVAAFYGRVEIVRQLIRDGGADIDAGATIGSSHHTALCVALDRGHVRTTKALLALGASVDVTCKHEMPNGSKRSSPLLVAADI
mmetsp:Transcript_17704/g.50578  ORF Transcript_17704/g.50578 Transcript_17704/m.50578 type:complete len:196 (-) Transcript_17704:168-755(-)